MTIDSTGQIRWRQYRQMRLFFWTVFLAVIAFAVFGGDMGPLYAFFVWAVVSAAVAFWPCPLCGGRVGYIPFGPFMILWPFGGWCTTCHRKLFRHKPHT